jgi:Gram-negative bacterial TonB protein C-terminal
MPGARLGVALIASVMLHGLTLISLPDITKGGIFVRPAREPVRVSFEKLPIQQVVAPIVVRARKELPRQELESPKSVAKSDRKEFERSLARSGVSVKDEWFLRPIPSGVNSSLLASGEYHRIVDITETPEPVAMKVPEYPLMAAAQKISGWVLVMLFVDEHGKAVETVAVDCSESFFGFADQVAAGLQGSTYTPGKLDGRAVKTLMFASVRFEAPKLLESQVAKEAHASLIFGYRANRQDNN